MQIGSFLTVIHVDKTIKLLLEIISLD